MLRPIDAGGAPGSEQCATDALLGVIPRVWPPLDRTKLTAALAQAWLRGVDRVAFGRACGIACDGLTNGQLLPCLFELFSSGDAYSCFALGVPILERAIGELVACAAASAPSLRAPPRSGTRPAAAFA
eukprot:420351-Prymnesium_polylepis.1